jgi:hypothetical protein
MSHGDLHQISAEIGGLKKSVEIMTDLWERQEESATAGRRALHEKFDMLRQQVGMDVAALSIRVDRLTDKVSMIEPSVTVFKEKMQADKDDDLREEGAQRLGLKLWAALMAICGLLGWGAHEFIGWIRHP